MPRLGPVGRFLVKSQLLTIFFALCALGIIVGLRTKPDPRAVPYAELFGDMSVVSYRDSPSDTTARFLVELSAGGKTFRQYDVDARIFLPPARDRDYNRGITGTFYRPLQARGHVAQGLWLVVSRRMAASLLPDQFRELYAATLDFVKPVSSAAGVVGMLSGYSIGYRMGIWNSTLHSRAVQARVLATPDIGRMIAREAWRRVLLEPVVMGAEEDASRFASIRSTQRIYSGFFRIALHDSDGFIPREAARLQTLGHPAEARAMLGFAEAVQRAAVDSVDLTSADFSAIEHWASLLVRHGHWAYDAMPPPGEERARYLGMLAWYGVAPPTPDADRVWVGPRMLVREGEAEGFVSDEIAATGTGCPLAWRALLRDQETNTNALATAWFSDHPEFTALASFIDGLGRDAVEAGRVAVSRRDAPSGSGVPARGLPPETRTVEFTSQITVRPASALGDSARSRSANDTLGPDSVIGRPTWPHVAPATEGIPDTLRRSALRDSVG